MAGPEPDGCPVEQSPREQVLAQESAGDADACTGPDAGAVEVDLPGHLHSDSFNAVALDPFEHLVAFAATVEAAESDDPVAVENRGAGDAAFGVGV